MLIPSVSNVVGYPPLASTATIASGSSSTTVHPVLPFVACPTLIPLIDVRVRFTHEFRMYPLKAIALRCSCLRHELSFFASEHLYPGNNHQTEQSCCVGQMRCCDNCIQVCINYNGSEQDLNYQQKQGDC